MHYLPADPLRIEVWVAMAEHFLDTETRHDIPLTALRCVQAGLATAQAQDVWRYEVSPALAFNLWDLAGEWVGWDRDWLVDRIERHRTRWHNCPDVFRRLAYRVSVQSWDEVSVSIGRCMAALLAVCPRKREQMSRDLALLAGHCFDFCPADLAGLDALDRRRIRRLYPDPFRHMMRPVLSRSEAFDADRRVRAALRQARKS